MNLPVKYRPKVFDEVLGQDHVTRTLRNALRRKEISSAYLFTGPRGVGKTTIARLLAKGLNCEKGITPEPCNKCRMCQDIDASRSLDVIEVDGASNRGIDQIRSLQEEVRFAPQRGRYRVIIIDEVHMLTQEAFNALLKTLEEPPPNVVFVMATTEPRKVPETIVSRTQRFDFRPVSDAVIAKRIKQVAELEGINIENGALMKIARHAEGSLRDGLALLEQLAVYSENNIKSEDVDHLLGVIEESFYVRLFEAALEKNTVKALTILDEIMGMGYSPQLFVKGFGEAAEKLLRAKYGLERNAFSSIAEKLSEGDALAYLKIALDLQGIARFTSNPRLLLDYHITRLTLMPSIVSIASILRDAGVNIYKKRSVTSLREEAEADEEAGVFESIVGSNHGPQTPNSAEFSKSTAVLTSESARPTDSQGLELLSQPKPKSKPEWDEKKFISMVETENPILAGILEYARIELDGDTILIYAQDPFQMDMIRHYEDFIRDKIKEILGFDAHISVEKGEETREEPDPVIARLIEKFDLEVI